MRTIIAILHTENDVLRIGRSLETLYPCDEVVVVDHGSTDGTLQIARTYAAHIIEAVAGDGADYYLRVAKSQASAGSGIAASSWLLCLDPRESLSESLAASLYGWKMEVEPAHSKARAFSVFLREETAGRWMRNPIAQTRLVPANWSQWQGRFPAAEPSAVALEGELLRFAFP